MIRLGVRVARERAEIVAAELMTLSPGGLEQIYTEILDLTKREVP